MIREPRCGRLEDEGFREERCYDVLEECGDLPKKDMMLRVMSATDSPSGISSPFSGQDECRIECQLAHGTASDSSPKNAAAAELFNTNDSHLQLTGLVGP